MAGFITLAQAIMGATGGVPVKPSGTNTVIERLRAAKSMIPGDIGGILGQVLQNGPGAILQNPIQSVLGQMNGGVGGLVSAISGAGDGDFGGMISALTGAGGLQGALGQLSQVSSALSGLTDAAAGGFGLIDAIGHGSLLGQLGANIPAGLDITTAMGPILMGSSLTPMVGQLNAITAAVTGGSVDVGGAIAQITGMTGAINATLNASTFAFSTVQNQAVAMARVSGIISALGSDADALGGIATMLIQPQHIPEIMAALTQQITP